MNDIANPLQDQGVPPAPPSPSPPAPPVITGAYGVWPADKDGNPIDYAANAIPNPTLPEALEIYFGILPGHIPPQNQNDLQVSLAQVLTVAKQLYIPTGKQPLPAFRLVYIRLFRLAQLGLVGDAAPDLAKTGLDRLQQDLIDAEGGRVKNRHLIQLGAQAAALAAVFVVLYLLLSALKGHPALAVIGVNAEIARSFMMLWVGCFAGVWLSYAIRTTTFTLRDLVITDADRLQPIARLIFAGLLTMALGLVVCLDWADLKLGQISLSVFIWNPTEALLFGLFCGASELLLPGIVGQRANELLSKLR